jgi:hypothetical protein
LYWLPRRGRSQEGPSLPLQPQLLHLLQENLLAAPPFLFLHVKFGSMRLLLQFELLHLLLLLLFAVRLVLQLELQHLLLLLLLLCGSDQGLLQELLLLMFEQASRLILCYSWLLLLCGSDQGGLLQELLLLMFEL